MAAVPIILRVATAQDLEAALNAALLPLTSDLIIGMQIDQTKPGPYNQRNIYVDFLHNSVRATPLLAPIQAKVITASTESDLAIYFTQYIASLPGYFISQLFVVYTQFNPDPIQGAIGILFYCSDPNASSNWSSGPSGSGGSTFLNPNPTPASVGGIPAGSTFPTPQTMQTMWNLLLYPYQAPAFTSFGISGQNPPFEVGHTVPASITFLWSTSNSANVQPNSISLLDITGSTTLATGLANTGSDPIVLGSSIRLVASGSYQFRITGTNSIPASFQSNLTLTWQWRLFYGTNAAVTLTGTQIGALSGSQLATGYAGTYVTPAGGYKYICQADAAGGQLNSVKDQSTGFNVPMAIAADNAAYSNVDGGGFSYALVPYTNVEGVTTNYRVYRTTNSLGGAVTLVVT